MRLYHVLALGVLIIAGVIIYGYINPTPDPIRQAEIANKLASMERARRIGDIFWPTLAAIVLAAAAGGARWVWRESGKPTEVHAEAGLYPVLVMDKSTPRDRFAGLRRVLTHNPNTGESLSVVSTPDGAITAESSIQPDHHADHIQIARDVIGVQKTQAAASGMRALKGPTVAEIKAQKGWYDNPPQRGGAQVIDNAPALPAPTQAPLTLADAMRPATAGDIVFGQEPDGARKLAVYRPADDYHISLLGSSGYGKSTNAAWTILMGFLRMGGRAVVAEPEGAAQFAEVQPWAEWARLDGAGLTRHAESIHREFQRRGDEMTRRGAGHFSDIPANERPPHLLAIFEEYTKARTQAQKAGTLADFDAILGELAQDAGKTGIHLLLIAQHFHPTTGQPWPATVRNNCGFRLSYNQPDNDSTKTLAGLYELSSLEKGQFAHRGRVYNGWHARPEAQRILANVPKRSGPGLLTAGPARLVAVQAQWVDGDPPVRRVRPSTPPPSTGEEWGTNTPTNTNTNTPTNSQGGEWDEFAQRFFEKNPYATQTALARAMADVDPEGRHYRRFVGGLSSGLFHQYSPNGDNYEGAPGREPEPVFAAEVEAYEPEPEPEQARPAGSRREPRLCTDSTGWIGHERVLSKDEWYESVRKLPIWWEEEE